MYDNLKVLMSRKNITNEVLARLLGVHRDTIAKGDEKLAYVESWLKKYGYDIDRFVIEAAVKEMNDRQLTVVAEELEIPDDGCQGKDYCEIE